MTQEIINRLKECPFCGDPMRIQGQLLQHVDQGSCIIGAYAWPVERLDAWNTRSTLTNLTPSGVEPWIVWSNEHNAFWRPKRCGYTTLIAEAGRYTKQEAESICRNAQPRANSTIYEGTPPEICMPAPEATRSQSERVSRLEKTPSDDVIEAAARGLCSSMGMDPDRELPASTLKAWQLYEVYARACLAAARSALNQGADDGQ